MMWSKGCFIPIRIINKGQDLEDEKYSQKIPCILNGFMLILLQLVKANSV